MALLLRVDGSQQTVIPAQPPSFTLKELHTLVGGYIEIVFLPSKKAMVINEEGKIQRLAYNENATTYARESIALDDYIVGNAVIVSREELGE